MKKVILIAFIGLIMFTSCSKEEEVTSTTRLELTLMDDSGNIIKSAFVRLYSSKEDMENGENQIKLTQISDESGKVKFNELTDIKYYWFAEKGCVNNANGTFTTNYPLTLYATNTVNVIMSGTGNIQLESTSDNPYQVYVNGIPTFEMKGGTTRKIQFMPTGSYSIRVLQLSGYLLYPTDETYSVVLNCGKTKEIIFPQSKKADS